MAKAKTSYTKKSPSASKTPPGSEIPPAPASATSSAPQPMPPIVDALKPVDALKAENHTLEPPEFAKPEMGLRRYPPLVQAQMDACDHFGLDAAGKVYIKHEVLEEHFKKMHWNGRPLSGRLAEAFATACRSEEDMVHSSKKNRKAARYPKP